MTVCFLRISAGARRDGRTRTTSRNLVLRGPGALLVNSGTVAPPFHRISCSRRPCGTCPRCSRKAWRQADKAQGGRHGTLFGVRPVPAGSVRSKGLLARHPLHHIWYVHRMTPPDKVIVARFCRLASGREPVRDWLREFSIEDRKLTGRDLMKVEFGWPCGPPPCRLLTGSSGFVRGTEEAVGRAPYRDVPRRAGRDHGAAARLHREQPGDPGEGAEVGRTPKEGL